MQEPGIEGWGMWAVLVGAVFEGEAVLIAAGYAVSQGYLPAAGTFGVAVLGGTLGDHLFYLTGRLWGKRILARSAGMRQVRSRLNRLLKRWGRLAAFAVRFAYGFRAVLPMSMGAVRFPGFLFFLPLNLLGAVAFASVYLSLGYFFGEVVEDLTGRMHGAPMRILLGILFVGAVLWIVREWKLFHPGDSAGEADYDPPGEG